jgi:DNA-binding transcriptional MocR family regulator
MAGVRIRSVASALTGWIRLWRKTMESAVWALEPSHFKVFITCLLMANNRERPWLGSDIEETIPRGSFITSQDHLAEAAVVSRRVVRRAFTNLERIGAIRSKPRSKQYTVITVVNFELYQPLLDDAGQEEGQRGAKDGPRTGHNERSKEVEKERNTSSGSALGPSWTEYLAQHSAEGQQVLAQIVTALATTRKTGKVAQSVLDAPGAKARPLSGDCGAVRLQDLPGPRLRQRGEG